MAAIKGEQTPAELVQQFDVDPNQIADWRKQLLDEVAEKPGPSVDVKTRDAKIGAEQEQSKIVR